jgi:hypothetical protein
MSQYISKPTATYWNRLEPRPHVSQLEASYTARVRDPLWFLTRQWQMGELEGEDAGGPAYVQCKMTTSPIVAWTPPTGPRRNLDLGVPLEPQMLSEPVALDLPTRIELAQNFELLLAESLSTSQLTVVVDAFRQEMPITIIGDDEDPSVLPFNPVEAVTQRYFDFFAGQISDGGKILGLARAISDGIVPAPAIPGADGGGPVEAGIRAALSKLLVWTMETLGVIGKGDPITWDHERLQHRAQVSVVSPTTGTENYSVAPGPHGRLDWMAFDYLGHEASEIQHEDITQPRTVQTTIVEPGHVRFRGQAAPRFWAFEPNELVLPDLRPDKRDVMKMMFIDFMMVHGNDWYMFPLEQQVGTIGQIEHVIVHDVFGHKTVVKRAETADNEAGVLPANERWSMFVASPVSGTPPAALFNRFLLPSSVGIAAQGGSLVEEVLFTRDEMANMAWAIERTMVNRLGEARHGNERHAAIVGPPTPPTPPTGDLPLRYQIANLPPIHWSPLFPVPIPGDAFAIALERGAVLRPDPQHPSQLVLVRALGRIMNPQAIGAGQLYRIPEEEILRSGVRVRRQFSRTRWVGGQTVLWQGRRRQAGSGESSSGLRFDRAEPNA